jgi:hypothetical protein
MLGVAEADFLARDNNLPPPIICLSDAQFVANSSPTASNSFASLKSAKVNKAARLWLVL